MATNVDELRRLGERLTEEYEARAELAKENERLRAALGQATRLAWFYRGQAVRGESDNCDCLACQQLRGLLADPLVQAALKEVMPDEAG